MTWLVVGAYIIAQAFRDTNLGKRISFWMIRIFGRSTLGLGYAAAFADFIIAPVTPSNAARTGGIIYPIFLSVAESLGSYPDKNPRGFGAYISVLLYVVTMCTGITFLTGYAANTVAWALADQMLGLHITWLQWTTAFILPAGIVLLIAMTGLDQDMMQRNLSCATPRDSQKNIVLTAVSQIFVIFLFLVLGVLLYIYMDRSGLAMPEKGDQVFSQVAVNGGLPVFVGILFVIGLISSTYSAAGSALTALTTSFTVDILDGTKRYGERRLTRLRRIVHVAMALGMALVILAFEYLADDSVINLVYKVASYTYGPILGMFAFGIFTRFRVRDGWMPLVALAAPLLSALLQYWAYETWGYRIGFELLIYNAAFTMAGMFLLVKRHEK